jgi:hypothetical protein
MPPTIERTILNVVYPGPDPSTVCQLPRPLCPRSQANVRFSETDSQECADKVCTVQTKSQFVWRMAARTSLDSEVCPSRRVAFRRRAGNRNPATDRRQGCASSPACCPQFALIRVAIALCLEILPNVVGLHPCDRSADFRGRRVGPRGRLRGELYGSGAVVSETSPDQDMCRPDSDFEKDLQRREMCGRDRPCLASGLPRARVFNGAASQ